MSYGLSGYTAVQKLPMLLDIEPWVPGNKRSARDSARELVLRARQKHPLLQFHIVVDSGFGSFEEIEYFHSLGVRATMSMPQNQRSWLWEALSWNCPINSGRAALVPLSSPGSSVLASVYHVISESNNIIDIRTLTSAFTWESPVERECVVARIGERRVHPTLGFFEYETFWADNDVTWQQSRSFMDDDGTFNIHWLQLAQPEDIRDALIDLSNQKLSDICEAQSWKVPSLSPLVIIRDLTIFL
jgi:hypothetical protein